jgi:hypothetical protein
MTILNMTFPQAINAFQAGRNPRGAHDANRAPTR